MKARLIRRNRKLFLLYLDGTIEEADNSILRMLFVGFSGADKFGRGKAGRWNTEYDSMEQHPGKTLAWVDDDNRLVIVENVFIPMIQSVIEEGYITVQEYAKQHGVSERRVKVWCTEGRLAGAVKKAGRWHIPRSAPRPADARYAGVEK